MSLKDTLKNAIEKHGRLTNAEVYQICFDNGYKPDNAMRRLRELMNETAIKAERDEKGVIHAYKWINPVAEKVRLWSAQFITHPEVKATNTLF